VRVERLVNGNYLLGVYIADVIHYVREGSALDKEAYKGGTSVYLVDRVINMISHKMTNGICPLDPGVDILTIGCEMEIDKNGKVLEHEIFEAVIRTTERMTYNNVNRILVDQDEQVMQEYENLVPLFQNMEALAEVLRRKRFGRGA